MEPDSIMGWCLGEFTMVSRSLAYEHDVASLPPGTNRISTYQNESILSCISKAKGERVISGL